MLHNGATHALLVLLDPAANPDPNAGPTIWYGIATAQRVVVRRSQVRLITGDMLLIGAVEMALDSLRRFLQDLPVSEKIDFEVP